MASRASSHGLGPGNLLWKQAAGGRGPVEQQACSVTLAELPNAHLIYSDTSDTKVVFKDLKKVKRTLSIGATLCAFKGVGPTHELSSKCFPSMVTCGVCLGVPECWCRLD